MRRDGQFVAGVLVQDSMVEVRMVSATQPAVRALDVSPIREALSTLRSRHDEWGRMLGDLFGALQGLRGQVLAAEQQLLAERERLAEERALLGRPAAAGGGKPSAAGPSVAETASQREALAAELAALRQQAGEMAEIVVTQRQRVAEERDEWTGELRQLRRILDQQSKWLEQRGAKR